MSKLTKYDFVAATGKLLAYHGCDGVSLSAILKSCGAQKGSLYHFFPEGKEELFVAAIELNRDGAVKDLTAIFEKYSCAAEAIYRYLLFIATKMRKRDFSFGMPFSALGAISGDSKDRIEKACMDACADLEGRISDKLISNGMAKTDAKHLCINIFSLIDGAHLQARIRKSDRPLREAAKFLKALIQVEISSLEN